jgi:outer membrane protein TolC
MGSTEAFYLTSLISRNPAFVKTISQYLIEQKIPSFSASKQHVEYGILASSSGDNSREQVFRRIGIVAADILAEREAAEISVALNTTENFYLNVETARQMDFSPPFEVMLTANPVGDSDTEGKVYSFAEIANIALEQNLDLKISYKDIDVAELDIRSSKANILPALNSGLTGSQINEERANSLVNSPERSLNLDLTLSQVIYSEEVLASIRIGQYLKSAQEYQTAVDVLNVLLDTYIAYLDVLSAKTNLVIQRENLDNTRTNLELAKIRVDLGSSNSSDLYRWESELANATQSLIESQAGLISVKLRLNNLLANALEDDFEVKDIGIEDELFTSFKNGPLSGLIKTPKDLKIASDFLVEESITNNPNKKQLLENIKATERQLELNKRLLYVPTIALQAQASEVLARGGEGSEEPESAIPGFNTEIENTSWFVGASLSYPVFTGNSRRVNKQRSQVQLEQLNYSNTSLDQSLELSIRASTVNLLSATTNLQYSAQSAASASQNFELVQGNYKAGNVNITQVIDAQQAALGAELGAALAVYEYIAANLQIEFGLGFFSMFLTETELADFQNRFLEYVSDN